MKFVKKWTEACSVEFYDEFLSVFPVRFSPDRSGYPATCVGAAKGLVPEGAG